MAKKKKSEDPKVESTENETVEETKEEITNPEPIINSRNMAKKEEEKLTPLDIKDPNAKIGLTLHNGKSVYYTPVEAIKPQNFKKLSKKSQDLLKNGKSASQMLRELD